MRVVPRNVQQVLHLVAVLHAVVLVPALDQPHHPRHHQPEGQQQRGQCHTLLL